MTDWLPSGCKRLLGETDNNEIKTFLSSASNSITIKDPVLVCYITKNM